MLSGLFKRKTKSVEAPSTAYLDRTAANRRMLSILERPTRKELNPPTLTPEDYHLAGYAMETMPAPPPDAGADQEPMDAQEAAQPEQAVAEAPAESPAAAPEETASVAADVPDDTGAQAAAVPETDAVSAEPQAEPAPAQEDDSEAKQAYEALRARLRAQLEDMRADETEDAAVETEAASVTLRKPGNPLDGTGEADLGQGDEDAVRDAEAEPVTDELADAVVDRNGDTPPASEPIAETAPAQHQDDGAAARDTAATVEDAADAAGAQGDVADTAAAPDDEPVEAALSHSQAGAEAAPLMLDRLPMPADLLEADAKRPVAEMAAQVVDYLLFDAGYQETEIAQTPFTVWCIDVLVAKAANGGLGGFAHDATGRPDVWEACAAGLEAMGASAHGEVFGALADLLSRDAALAEAVAADPDGSASDARLAELDEAFARANDEFDVLEAAGHWLEASDALTPVAPERFQLAVNALGEHPELEQRR